MHNDFKSWINLLHRPPFKLINWRQSENREMNFHQRATHKEVRVHTRAKWRICRKYPFISSWLTGACGGGEPKSVLVCSEASANHTWPLPSTLANERWPLGAICCELLQSQQQQRTVPGQEHRNTSAWGRAVSTGRRSELKEVNWKPDSSRWLSRFSKLKKNKKQNTNYVHLLLKSSLVLLTGLPESLTSTGF